MFNTSDSPQTVEHSQSQNRSPQGLDSQGVQEPKIDLGRNAVGGAITGGEVSGTQEDVPGAVDTLPAILNDRWRVIYDPLQWILQLYGAPKWRDKSFCVTREGLLRCIREKAPLTRDLTEIKALPDYHPDRAVNPGLATDLPPGAYPKPASDLATGAYPNVPPARHLPSINPHGPTPGALQGDDYTLEYYGDGCVKLPDCLRRVS
jgi:hypothetical protein